MATPTDQSKVKGKGKGKGGEKGKGGKVGAQAPAFQYALKELLAQWTDGGKMMVEFVREIPRPSDNILPGAVFTTTFTSDAHKKVVLKKGRAYHFPVNTFNVRFTDADLFSKDKKVEQDNMYKFLIDPIIWYDEYDGKHIMTFQEIAVLCEQAGMTSEMYEIGPDIKSTSANNNDVLSMTTALYLYPAFAQGFGSQSQSAEYYVIKTGKKAGQSICLPSQKIPSPPRAIQHIDGVGVLHHRKPFLPGACQACFSYEHKEYAKECIMTDFCRNCFCYFPDEEHGSHGHACTTGITGSGNAIKKGKGTARGHEQSDAKARRTHQENEREEEKETRRTASSSRSKGRNTISSDSTL